MIIRIIINFIKEYKKYPSIYSFYNNIKCFFLFREFQTFDILQAAIEAEYQVFTNNKVVTMYRKNMVKLIQTIKADTKAWKLTQALADYKREEQGKTLAQLAKSIEIKKSSEIDVKTSSSSNQNTPTKPRGKGFNFKRETKDQKSMTDYFKQKPKEENGHENSNGDMFIDSDNDDEPSLTIHEEMEIENDYCEKYPDENDEKSSIENDEESSNENERSSDESIKKSSNENVKKSSSPPNTKVDLFGDSDENEDLPLAVTESKVEELSNNNNSYDAGKNDLFNKLEAKISQLTQV